MSGRLSGEFYRAGAVTGGAPAVFRCVKNTFFSHKMCAFLFFVFLPLFCFCFENLEKCWEIGERRPKPRGVPPKMKWFFFPKSHPTQFSGLLQFSRSCCVLP